MCVVDGLVDKAHQCRANHLSTVIRSTSTGNGMTGAFESITVISVRPATLFLPQGSPCDARHMQKKLEFD